MKMIHFNSLTATLDAVNEMFFFGRFLSNVRREETAKWIADRQDKSGPNVGMFVPTENDYKEGVSLFSGEKIKTLSSTSHILGEEASRILILLDVPTVEIQDTLKRANRRMLSSCFARSCIKGECAHATVGFMRYLAVGGAEDSERRLDAYIVATNFLECWMF